VALGIHNAMRMRRIVICGLYGSTIFFSTLPHKRHDFLKERKMCFDFVYNFLCETFLIPRPIHRDAIINVHSCSCKIPAILVRLNLNFHDRFSKYVQISNIMKIRRMGAEVFNADTQAGRQADRST
jgi:hypothetical protein